jgi:endonuclease YncB( thermonuclease family)
MNKASIQIAGAAAALFAITASYTDAQSQLGFASNNVPATYCENSACEPVMLQISSGDSFIVHRWGNHREEIRIANIDAPSLQARCIGERASGERATVGLRQSLAGSTFTMARLSTDSGGSIALVSIDRRDLGHQLVLRNLVWPWEPRHRSWC